MLKRMPRLSRYKLQVLTDVGIIILVYCIAIPLLLKGFPLNLAPIDCHDETIKQEYQHSIVPTRILLLGAYLIPLVTFLIAELALSKSAAKTVQNRHSPKLSPTSLALRRVSRHYFLLVLGLGLNIASALFIKIFTGRPRPTFWHLCQPNITVEDCGERFVTDYVCTNEELPDILLNQLNMSFPSGHASIAMFTALYLMHYHQWRWHSDITFLLKPVIQVAHLVLALYTGASRVVDNHHHPCDVIWGFLLGAAIAAFMIINGTDNYPAPHGGISAPEMPTPSPDYPVDTTPHNLTLNRHVMDREANHIEMRRHVAKS